MSVERTEQDFNLLLRRHIAAIEREYLRTIQKHRPMNGSHEGYAILLEEVDEMWDAIKANDISNARAEAIQVAAMALAFLMEVGR